MARPIWRGSITFGLVNIPVQLEMALRDKTVSFHMMSKDGACRLRRKLYCPETGQEFDFDQTARGIEIGTGEYALVDQSEIERLKPESGRALEIVQFVRLADIDPLYFDRPYFVIPTEGSIKPYKPLSEAMSRRERIALARFVMRERQYLAAIRVLGDGLVLHALHYADEVLSIDDSLPGAVARAKSGTREIQAAIQLIDSMTRAPDLSSFHDEYREQLEQMVAEKKHGKKVHALAGEHHERRLPRTVNLIDALRRSLRMTAGVSGNGRHANGCHPGRARNKRMHHSRKR